MTAPASVELLIALAAVATAAAHAALLAIGVLTGLCAAAGVALTIQSRRRN